MGQRMGDHVFYRDLHRDYPVLERGDGVYLYDVAGKRYIDGSAGALVCSLGHGHREVAEHMRTQAARLEFVPIARFTHGPQVELAARLVALAGPGLPYSYFVSGGSEAVETAIKMARQYHTEKGHPGRFLVIGRQPAYHGNTLACLAAGAHPGRRRPYEPYLMPSPKIELPHCSSCPYHLTYPACGLYCANALEGEITRAGPDSVSCFILETITGSCGGVIIPPPGYIDRIAEICARYDVVLIADEVMCGAGRTGRFLAASHFGRTPDIVILGKGIAAGYAPLAALLVSQRIYDAFEAGSGAFINNYTYAANPVACATACKVLEILVRDALIERAAVAGALLKSGLEKLAARHASLGTEVRQIGLMIAADLFQDRDRSVPFGPEARAGERLARACLDEGLVIYPGLLALAGGTGDCFLLGPPFTITDPEIDELLAALGRALTRVFSG